ncbi:MAG: DUF1570 domain-containing protein, partial [Planctomycetota bacterium]
MSRLRPQPRLALAAIVAALALVCTIGAVQWTDAGRHLEQTLLPAARPNHSPVTARQSAGASSYAALQTLLGVRPDRRLKTESDVYRRTQKLLPDRFGQYETRRFIVLSDAKPGWTRQQSQLLERTYHQFHRYTRRIGIEPRPLRHKLVCVLFQEYDDYRQFAKAHDDVTSDWISGYYSPRHDRIVFYNIETNPDYARVRGADGPWAEAAVARGRLSEEFDAASIATTVHEAIHQLTFHTRIQSAQIQNPLWISEGLATAFETDRPDEAFGPDHEYSMRRDQFDRLLADGDLIP